ncbi:hypothetical protein PV08_02552 [Exophiala spinifera]|uniref:BZIP domain-containing protein n=1 Tax=Exophiala spinifera TaxID=91928 RepID=A0A0D2C3P4_9EURO|nr:uncharacterized protein PV08_02552 [Exophiala spinifera]KIW18264.1 hypothetical protein PV08_02552 [Exophiala spinifera]
MSSSAASPPTAGSPPAPIDVKPILTRQPSLCAKPIQTPPATSPASTTPSATLSLTSKEWIIPPRPKPGRKPATDTPPTKRKAQNRAAQRAFRERRAARVGELEEQLKQIEEENEQEQDALRGTIEKLEKEIDQYRHDLTNWVDRCRKLENELVSVRSASPQDKKSGEAPTTEPAIDDNAVGCGNCTLETRCQCIDDAFQAMSGETSTSTHQHEKRPHSPIYMEVEKRIKVEPKEAMEVDFTSMYSAKDISGVSHAEQHSPTSAIADPCGFCSDGTPCICAEMAAEREQAQNHAAVTGSVSLHRPVAAVNPPRQLDQFTPPPSEGDVSMSVPAVAEASSSGCASGPGTCAQCRADPNSTLFCKSLAASRAQSASTPSGCCGGQTPGSRWCCQSQPDSVPLPPRTTRSRAGVNSTQARVASKASVTLTCADAYTTLSRHPAYESASDEIATWLPKLHASDAQPGMVGRPALEIDAANVMAVLKDFDRRFGQSR